MRLRSVGWGPGSPWASLRRVGSQGHGPGSSRQRWLHLRLAVQGPAQEREGGGRPHLCGPPGLGVALCLSRLSVCVCLCRRVWGIRVQVTNRCLSAPASLLTPRGCGGLPRREGLYPAGLVFHPSRWYFIPPAGTSCSRAQCCASPVEGAGATCRRKGPQWLGGVRTEGMAGLCLVPSS